MYADSDKLKSIKLAKRFIGLRSKSSFSPSWQASLGTTKYCSYFLKSMQCPKPDCMYLHELGDEAASFTKEEMQVHWTPFWGGGGMVVIGAPSNTTLQIRMVYWSTQNLINPS